MFRCLALLRWEKTSRKGAMRAVVGSNLYCSLLHSKSPLMCIVGKQRKDHTPRSLNYCFFTNQWVIFFAMPFLGHLLGCQPSNQSSWICIKQTRIHRCHLHEIWMEGEVHTHPLCLWRDKLCGSQPHMQTGWLHFNKAQVSQRL